MRKNKKRKNNEPKELTKASFFISCLIATALFYLLALAIMTGLSLFLYKNENAHALISLIGKGSLIVSAVISAFLLSLKNKELQALSGAVLSLLIILTLVLISLFVPGSISLKSVPWYIFTFVACIIGSVLGAKTFARKRKRHHK